MYCAIRNLFAPDWRKDALPRTLYQVAEIAKLMNAREGTVKSWLFRARDMLRELLKGEYPDV